MHVCAHVSYDYSCASQLPLKASVRMSVWEALATLDGFVDLSDPDTSLPNSVHAFQAAPYLVVTLPMRNTDILVAI